jgi:hypothetical protein
MDWLWAQMIGRVGSGRISTMNFHVISDHAVEGGRAPAGGIAGWLGSYLFRAAPVLSFSRDLAATVRNSGLARASWNGTTRIRVPPMSEAWLRMHETDYDKHRAEL